MQMRGPEGSRRHNPLVKHILRSMIHYIHVVEYIKELLTTVQVRLKYILLLKHVCVLLRYFQFLHIHVTLLQYPVFIIYNKY